MDGTKCEYRFVWARRYGLLELGTGSYTAPIRRGEVVTLVSTAALSPSGDPLQPPSYVVEQVVHTVAVRPPDAEEGATLLPAPHTVAKPTVYVSLLDESGQVIPHERGTVPGLCVSVEP